MKFDPNARNRLDRTDRRKDNRIEEIEVLPSRAERGDIVHMDGSTYVYLRGKWVNLNGNPCLPLMKSGFRYAQPANLSRRLG